MTSRAGVSHIHNPKGHVKREVKHLAMVPGLAVETGVIQRDGKTVYVSRILSKASMAPMTPWMILKDPQGREYGLDHWDSLQDALLRRRGVRG